MTIGTSLWRRSVRHSSKPSMPGSMMSISTTSGSARWKRSMASSPLPASSTVQPSSSSASLTAVRMRSSSSTERMRVPTGHMMPGSAARFGVRRATRSSARTTPDWPQAPRRTAIGPPSKPPGSATRFARDQFTRSPVPRAEPLLEEHVESSGGEVAQVRRSGPEAADVADSRDRPRRSARA